MAAARSCRRRDRSAYSGGNQDHLLLPATTIILPISRDQHLLKVFASLELLECDRERTSLLALVDGEADLFLMARNLVDQSKFAERLCVQGNIPGERREFSINTRRRRIAAIHNEIRELIKPCEYVFLIEDDGVLPADALSRLLADYLAHPYAGFIEGVELGRWGIPYVGAWRADDVYDTKRIESVLPHTAEILDGAMRPVGEVPDRVVEEIDAGGLYACLTRYRHYVDHEFRPFDGCAFGPDIEWGIALRQQGYRNHIDWSVAVEHCKSEGDSVHPMATPAVRFCWKFDRGLWNGSVIEK